MQAATSNGISLADARSLLPQKQGKPVSMATLRRWVTRGVRGVYLGAFRVGGDWYTTPEDVQRFIQETTQQAMPERQRTPAQRRAAAADAMAWIEARYGRVEKSGQKEEASR